MTATHTLLRDGERYELLGELASGGMATVYLARMRRPMGFSRLVAIKCMHPQFAKDSSFVSMFMDEARLTARLRHPNVVPTMDIVAEDGHLLLVMEYVEGASLATLLHSARDAGTKIPLPIACAIVHDMLLGLHEAHQAKDDDGVPLSIIHRDVSPQNVLVGVDGLSRVLDFGVAKARQNTHRSNDNEIKGKIPYMPPEQLFGEALDHRVDVYAAGVTLWEAICCERLFDCPSETALVRQISETPIRKPSSVLRDLPHVIDAVVMKALSRDANERFESALAMAEAISAVIALPTRTEISTWVRQYVEPREVPSGTHLPASSTPPVSPLEDNIQTAMLGILERASLRSPSQRRGSLLLPLPLSTEAYSAPMRPSSHHRTTRVAIGFATFAFCVAGLAVAKVAKSENAQTTRRAHVVSAEPTQLVDTPAVVPVVKPAAVLPKTPSVRTYVTPKAATAKPSSSNCKIPYTIDGSGSKHYKVECI